VLRLLDGLFVLQYARIPLKLAEGIELSVGVYNLIYPTKKPSAVQLETATNQRVKTETNWLCSDTGRQLLPHEIRTYQKFADSRVMFDKEDMKQIKNFGFPGASWRVAHGRCASWRVARRRCVEEC